ncbi:MAG TPA: hypothetical protein VFB38_09970 [Chthonomonadaceae bacterium]|jgi:hypothetical protein|nr:hypothetical protein [Chthonomonadaceae bacterium]
MLTTIEGIYRHGKIELAEMPAGVEEARVLVTFLPDGAAPPAAKSYQELYGVWRDKFPPDFDLDAALKEIRSEWKEELEEGGVD